MKCTLFEHILKLGMVLRAVMIADNRGAADSITDKNRDENELNVHQHAVSGHAVFARKFHQLKVIEHSDNRV